MMQYRLESFKGNTSILALCRACGTAVGWVGFKAGAVHLFGVAVLGALITQGIAVSAAYADNVGSQPSGESGGADDGDGGDCAKGDCGEENSKDGEANDTGDGEVCRDEDTCPCNSGNGAQGLQDVPSGPSRIAPVSWSTGEKWETVVDLRVKVQGADFRLTRQYSSDLPMFHDGGGNLYDNAYPPSSYLGAGLTSISDKPSVGEGWAFSNLRAMTARIRQTCIAADCGQGAQNPTGVVADQQAAVSGWLLRPSRKPRQYAVGISGINPPGNQEISVVDVISYGATTGEVCVDCSFGNEALRDGFFTGTIRYSEPGKWYQDFAVEGGFGFISADVDQYGNRRDYVDTSSDGIPDVIYLNGDAGAPSSNWEAKVVLDWAWASSSTPVLSRAEVYRPGVTNPTQIVAYYHLDDDGGMKVKAWDPDTDTWSAVSGITPSSDLGTDGDLVQVIRYTAINPEATDVEYRPLITQYRYHDNTAAASAGTDIRLRTQGKEHQIKMEFMPQQVEFLAQDSSATSSPLADEMLSNGDWVEGTMVSQALELLEIDDDATVTNSTHKMYEAAEKIISYTRSGFSPVDFQFLQAMSCGCGGSGSTSAIVRTYDMIDGWSKDFGLSPVDGQTMEIQEYNLAGRMLTDDYPWNDTSKRPYRAFFYDMLKLDGDKPYVWMKTLVSEYANPDDPNDYLGDAWVTRKSYNLDLRTVMGMVYPSGFSAYTPATPTTPPSATVADDGLRVKYSYPLNNENVQSYSIAPTDSGGSPSFTDVSKIEYLSSFSEREYLPSKRTDYRTGATGDNVEEVTEFAYGFDGNAGDAKLDWRRITYERELPAENGPEEATMGVPEVVHEWEFYDDQGLLIVRLDAGGTVMRYEYDDSTGQLVKVTRNYDPGSVSSIPGIRLPDTDTGTDDGIEVAGGVENNPFSGLGTPSDGTLVTQYEYDILGRLTKVIRPGGVNSWTFRELREDPDHTGILYFTKISLPHYLSGTSPKAFNGPARVRYYDGAGDVTRRESYDLSTTATYNPDATTGPVYTVVSEIARSALTHDLSGSATGTEIWWDVSADESYTSSTEYDAFGRVSEVTDANGNITQRVYDAMDRVIEVKVGTASGTETIAEYYYDGDPAAIPAQGVGDGNLTAEVMKDGIGDRITRMYYDHRDRRIATVAPAIPITITHYDNLNRPIERGIFPEPTSTPTLSNIRIFAAASLAEDGTGLNLPSGEKRSWYTKTFYSQRGMVYRHQTAIDPSLASPTFLEWNSWYDPEGYELASWGPNAPITVSEYDELNRVSKVMIADRLTDIGTSDWDFEAAISVAGDHVLEQSEYRYESGSGLLDLVTSRMALHNNSTTGILTGSNAISTYAGYIYDDAHRGIAAVSFGTNKSGSNPFSATAGTVPTLSSYATLSDLRSATDVLFNWREYNTRGLVEDIVSLQSGTAAGDEIRTRYLYDDLSRSIAMVENADAVSSVTWDGTGGVERYTVSGFDYTKPDTDRVTSFVYDGASHIIKRVAHSPEDDGSGSTTDGAQVTQYKYGVTSGSSANIMDSLVYSNNLLAEVRYPNESTGDAGATDEYKVKYAYNRLGELRGVTDQNGTIRQIVRDQHGRATRDSVNTVGTGVDDTIRMLEYSFDTSGRLSVVSSYTGTGGTIAVRDQVEFGYTPLWQIETVSQQYDGVVTSGSPQVLYRYDDQTISGGSDNYSRLTDLVYPTDNNGNASDKTVVYAYDSGIDDSISRVSSIGVEELTGSSGVQDLISYDRIGLGMTAIALMPNAGGGIQLDRTFEHDGSQTTGAYPAFDQFGRVVRHMWVRDDFSTGTGSDPNQPAVVEITHTYDRMSNRMSYQDERVGAKFEDRNRAFEYDGLNRLTREIRLDASNTTPDYSQPLPPSSTYSSQHYSRQWDLDTLGNWSSLIADADEDGDLTDAQGNGHLDTRGANNANEYEGVLNANYDRKVSNTFGFRYYDYAYDKNGNLAEARSGTSIPMPPDKMAGIVHTYDAWNRLVKSEFEPLSGSNVTVSEYTYNGLGWRTSKSIDTATGAYDGLDQERLFLYDASWRIVEEHIDTDLDSTIDWINQEYWGVRYIDDSVAKRLDRDADGDWTDAETSVWYRATDTLFSVVAMIDSGGDMYERVEYDAYGNARHRYYGDVNGDGVFTTSDLFTISGASGITSTKYHADIDTDFDGAYQTDEITAYSSAPSTALPDGWISDPSSATGPDNSIGYAGYVFNPEREDYTVRFRNYNPDIGQWMQHDPVGYQDGSALNKYVESNPVNRLDSYGLCAVNINCTLIGESSASMFQKTCKYSCRETKNSSKNKSRWNTACGDLPCDDPAMPSKPITGGRTKTVFKGTSCDKSFVDVVVLGQDKPWSKDSYADCVSNCGLVAAAIAKSCKTLKLTKHACKAAKTAANESCLQLCDSISSGGFK